MTLSMISLAAAPMMIMAITLSVALGLVLLAVFLLQGGRSEADEKMPLPQGRIIYEDNGEWRADLLVADSIGLMGKPDYLVQQGEMIIPVEIKSALAPQKPYCTHLLQLAAYCYLVEENYGIRPTHGVLNYRNDSFEIPYTVELEQQLLHIIKSMHKAQSVDYLPRSHHLARRCRSCAVYDLCEERLT